MYNKSSEEYFRSNVSQKKYFLQLWSDPTLMENILRDICNSYEAMNLLSFQLDFYVNKSIDLFVVFKVQK